MSSTYQPLVPAATAANDPMWNFIFSGNAHVYYALFAGIALSFAVLFGWISELWLAVVLALEAGVLADLWAHGYNH